ncbi:MAG: hypothetical protein H0W24_11035 [Lysobacter sp.]|nr:hypothetical protein [Lysobacter sp.]
MARYLHYDADQTRLVAISYARQLLPGTFEHALSYLIDNEVDLGRFADRFNNDATGAPAYDPAILLKIVLFAYSRGITSSRTMRTGAHFIKKQIGCTGGSSGRLHFSTITVQELLAVEDQLNDRPRKRLGYLTPGRGILQPRSRCTSKLNPPTVELGRPATADDWPLNEETPPVGAGFRSYPIIRLSPHLWSL